MILLCGPTLTCENIKTYRVELSILWTMFRPYSGPPNCGAVPLVGRQTVVQSL